MCLVLYCLVEYAEATEKRDIALYDSDVSSKYKELNQKELRHKRTRKSLNSDYIYDDQELISDSSDGRASSPPNSKKPKRNDALLPKDYVASQLKRELPELPGNPSNITGEFYHSKSGM